MFQKAYNLANRFTQPFIICTHHFDGSVESGLGTFVVINKEGWAMTAAHNFQVVFNFNQHQIELKNYKESLQMINVSTQLNEEEKQTQRNALSPNPKWIEHYTILLAGQPFAIYENFIYGEHDIAFFRMDTKGIHPQMIYPKIINPRGISPGISLCKLGFPFIEFQSTFNIQNQQFVLPPNLLPMPLFPIEGIYTRNFYKGKTNDGSMDILFLETSSPGLRGQSGGPLFDVHGNVYAIQSQNLTIPLGYSGKALLNGKPVEENQFLNLGIGVHPSTLEILLNKHQIQYEKGNVIG
jgi:hypothetical protein